MVTVTSAAPPDRARGASVKASLLADAADDFATLWNRRSFAFQHRLAHHPLFSLEALREVAERTPKYDGFVHWQNGRIAVTDSWEINTGKRLSLDETILGIAENDSQVVLKHAEQDASIGPVLRDLLAEVVDLAPAHARDDITIGESIIFISSPRRVTKYHIDLEASCLLQVSGEKTVHIFDPSDPSILSLEEIEKQCCGNQNAAVFKPDRQAAAQSYAFRPGVGAHFPSLAPHWVENGDNVSISININFELRSVHHRLRAIHRFNRRLRRFGLTPSPPGRSPLLDDAKASVENGLTAVRRALKPSRPADAFPVWTPRQR
jgi:hypothetical protein